MKNNFLYCKNEYIVLFFALVIFAINQIPFLSDIRPIMYDEAWYLNTAYNFLNGNGFYNTVVGSGGNANFLAPMILALFMKIFGQTLLAARLAAVFCGFISIFIIHAIMNELQIINLKTRIIVFSIFISLLLINSTYRFVRPEFLVCTLLLINILFLLKYIKKESIINILGLSVSTFCAICAHPSIILFLGLVGIYLFIRALYKKNLKLQFHNIILLLFALLGILMITLINLKYNDSNIVSLSNRVVNFNFIASIRQTLKIILKHSIYVLPMMCVNFLLFRTKSKYKFLAVLNIVSLCTFPIIFSGDVMMVGYCITYFTIISLVIMIVFYDEIRNIRRYNVIFISTLLFCGLNLSFSYYYNYNIKYEKCNTILYKDVNLIIPDNSLIFGSLRLWPFKMNSTFYSDHNRIKKIPKTFDYLLLNSKDQENFGHYKEMKEIIENLTDYKLIYNLDTKQYGRVTIWKHN